MTSTRSPRRELLHAMIGAAAGASFALPAFGQPTPDPIKATKLTEQIVVFTGDGGNVGLATFFSTAPNPVVDYSTGGWIGVMAGALDKLLQVGDAKTQSIPGHDPLSTKDDITAAHDVIHTISEHLDQFSKKGASLDDVLKANPVSEFEAKWGQGLLNGERFLRLAYPSIAKHPELVRTAGAKRVSW